MSKWKAYTASTTAPKLKALLVGAAGPDIGGLFNGSRMWAAVVNRDGELCAVAASTDDKTQVWPGSQSIAKAEAYTANAFSLDSLALSTARLYTFTQPGHSLWSLGQANPFDPKALAPTGSVFTHPLCLNTKRNGVFIGTEAPATGY